MSTALVRLSGPASEPVTLAEAKAHLRVVTTDEDSYIQGLIALARTAAEEATGRAFLTQSWRLRLDAWPNAQRVPAVALPRPPLRDISAVRIYDSAGAAEVWDAANYDVDTIASPGRLLRKPGAVWPVPGRFGAGIEIDFEAGYGATSADVPAPLRHAILLHIAHLYENREPVFAGGSVVPIPMASAALLAPYQMVRL